MAGGGIPTNSPTVAGGYLSGKQLIYPLSLVISLFFLWGFSVSCMRLSIHKRPWLTGFVSTVCSMS